MDFRYFLPTQIYFGEEVLERHSSELTRWGKKALIVTGRSEERRVGK